MFSLALSGSTMYVGGFFGIIGGQTRSGIAAIDLTTGLASTWNPNANNIVYGMAVSGSKIYACGTFTNIGGQTRNRIAALDLATGNATAWDPNANAAAYVLALNGSEVYIGGDFTFVGGQTRHYIASLDQAGAANFTWDANASASVYAMEAYGGNTLYVGGAFSVICGLGQVGYASITIPNTVDAPFSTHGRTLVLASAPNPARTRAEVSFSLPNAGPVSLAVYDAAGRRVASLLNGQRMTAGPHSVTLATGTMQPGLYFARLEYGFERATQKLMVVR